MKARLTLAAFALIAASLMTAPAAAQVASQQHKAEIPFAFHVGNVEMPAGAYVITVTENHIQLQSIASGKAAAVAAIRTVAKQDAEVSHLKFDRQGDTLYLTDVFFGGGNEGIELVPDKIRAASRM